MIEVDLTEIEDDFFTMSIAAFQLNKLLNSIFKGEAPIKEPLISAFNNLIIGYKVPFFLLKKMASQNKGTRYGKFLKGMIKGMSENADFIEEDRN